MGEAFLDQNNYTLTISSTFYFYGNAASQELSERLIKEVADAWNEAQGLVKIKNQSYKVQFMIDGRYTPTLLEETILKNTNPKLNFFRVENFSNINISFVDDIKSNTGYMLLDNLYANSTTFAHEYGHTLGLVHPEQLDIRGFGQPGIMYPRGTWVDPEFQYDPKAEAGAAGGTVYPIYRRVWASEIDLLDLQTLVFKNNKAIVGDFTNKYHEAHIAPNEIQNA